MARLEQAMKTIVEVFVEYANGDGKLNEEELKKLFDKEIENAEVKGKLCKVGLCNAMGRMDKDRDGEINFREFSRCLCVMLNCHFHKKTGKGEACDE